MSGPSCYENHSEESKQQKIIGLKNCNNESE